MRNLQISVTISSYMFYLEQFTVISISLAILLLLPFREPYPKGDILFRGLRLEEASHRLCGTQCNKDD